MKQEALPSPQLHLTSLHQLLWIPRITDHTIEEDLPEPPYQHTPVFHTAHRMLYRGFQKVHEKVEVKG